MPKLKTKKTLSKRIKLTKGGKLVKKQNGIGHLKRKMDAARKGRKSQRLTQHNNNIIKNLKRLLGR